MTIQVATSQVTQLMNQSSGTLLTGMDLTPGAGTYLAIFSHDASTGAADTGDWHEMGIYVNDVVVLGTDMWIRTDGSVDSNHYTIACAAIVSPTAGQTVRAKYAADSGSFLTSDNRQLILIPLSAGDYMEGTDAETSIGTGDTTVETVTTPAAGTYLVIGSLSLGDGSTVGDINMKIKVDGTEQTNITRRYQVESSEAGANRPFMLVGEITVDGTQDVTMTANRTGSSSVSCWDRNITLVADSEIDIFEEYNGTNDTDSTTDRKQIDNMQVATPGADDYVGIWSGEHFVSSANGEEVTLDLDDGAQITTTTKIHTSESSVDAVDLPVQGAGFVDDLGASDNISWFWQHDGTTTRIMKNRSLVVIREASAGSPTDDLLADDVEAASEVSSPAIGQEHAILVQSVESASGVSTPALGQEHGLLADDVESTSEVSTPSLAVTSVLLADDVESASELTTPALGQVHGLLVDDVEAASELTSPNLGQEHTLLADDVESASALSSPTLTESNALLADDVESASEVSTPAIGQVHVLSAADVESASEVSTPAISTDGTDGLLADDVESASEVSTPALGQVHALVAVDLEALSQLTRPALNGADTTYTTVHDALMAKTGESDVSAGWSSIFGRTAGEHLQDAEHRWLIAQGGSGGANQDMWIEVYGPGDIEKVKLDYLNSL